MGRVLHARHTGCLVRIRYKTAAHKLSMKVSGLKMVRLKMHRKEVSFIACILFCGQASGMGDRWAWRSDVSSRRSQLDTDTSDNVIDETEDESTRTARKVESESVEARFFLKDKLCAIGLADCSNDLSEAVQYVQPVKVVPVGQPIPAVAAEGFDYTVPVENPIANRDFSVSSGYGAPSYSAPKPSYGAPKPTYGAPKPTYGAPKPTYDAPKPTYGAPKPTYKEPSVSYGPPSYNTPTTGYRGPKPSYNAPNTHYGAPHAHNSVPTSEYGAPKPSYNAPSATYGSPSYDSLTSKLDTVSSFQTSFSAEGSDYSEKARPVREGRLDECYCVPVAQCPANKILGSSFKDYSNLINPRVKNSDIGITAPVARTLLDTDKLEDTEEANKKDEPENIEDSSKTDVGKERSLIDSLEEDNGDEEESSTVEKRRLENVFIPEVEEVEVLSRDG